MFHLRNVVVLTVLVCAGVQAANKPKPATASAPEVHSQAALVIDASNSTVLFARNAAQARPIASLTKLMTALVVLEGAQPLDSVIEIVAEDRSGTHGAASRLSVGSKFTRAELLHLALMVSDNRAAYALGRTYPSGTAALVRAMNAKAHALQMTQAHFVDASGLSPDNVASAADVAKLVVAAAAHVEIRNYSTDHLFEVTVVKRAVEFRNTNYLVAKDDWQIDLQKTGYTNDAGRCLAMKTTIQDRSLIIVLLDSFGKYTRTADARRIRKWLESRPPPTVIRAAM